MTILNRSVLFFYIIFFPTISLANVLRVREEEECTPIYVGVPNPHPLPDAKAPAIFNVSFFSSISDMPIILEVTRLWAPLGVDRFYQLTLDNYYNCAGFFRVVPGISDSTSSKPVLILIQLNTFTNFNTFTILPLSSLLSLMPTTLQTLLCSLE